VFLQVTTEEMPAAPAAEPAPTEGEARVEGEAPRA